MRRSRRARRPEGVLLGIVALASVLVLGWRVMRVPIRADLPGAPAPSVVGATDLEDVVLATDAEPVEPARERVEDPAPVERAPATDPRYYGLVLAAEDDARLAGVRVHRLSGEGPSRQPVESHTDGTFALTILDEEPVPLAIEDAGRGMLCALALPGATTVDAPAVFRLPPAASIDARVLDHAGFGVADVEVVLSARPRELCNMVLPPAEYARFQEAVHWSARTDDEGRARIEGLPPAALLEVVLQAGERVLARPAALHLRAGEHAEPRWSVEGGTTILGTVVDANGTPLADAEVWRLAGIARSIALQEHHSSQVQQSARTDSGGAFRLEEVPPGRWWLGAAPFDDVVSQAVSIRTALSEPVVEVSLVAHRGLYVRGEVLDRNGRPVERASVSANRPGTLVQFLGEAVDGRFAIGPLVPGEYELSAGGYGALSALPIVAEAGAEGVVLRLRPAGVLVCRVVDAATGETTKAAVQIVETEPDREPDGYRNYVDIGTEVDFRGLDPEREHALIARTSDGRVGMLTVLPDPEDAEPTQHELSVAPGGLLRLVVREDVVGGFAIVWWGDAPATAQGLLGGGRLEVRVPPGPGVVTWQQRGREGVVEVPFVATAGTPAELVLGVAPDQGDD